MPQIERLADRLHQGVTFITFHGANIPAVRGGCKRDARAYRLAIHHQCAGAADPVLAPDMRAGEQAVLADKVGERETVIDGARYPFAVHADSDRFHLKARMARNTIARCMVQSA
jgi:hypothetical protein